MKKFEQDYIIELVNDIINRFDHPAFLDRQEQQVVDILKDAVKKIKGVKI